MIAVLKDFYKGKTVFVTGHTGFKGTWLVKILINLGAKVVGYSLQPNTEPNVYHLANVDNKIVSIIGDVRDYERLFGVISEYKPEIIFHLAAQPLVRESYINPKYTYETNSLGTLNILEIIRKTDFVKSVINITTDKVYRNLEIDRGYKEDEELDGFDPYSNSKSVSELITNTYKRSFFADNTVRISTVRAGNVIGGGDFSKDRIIPDCVKSIINDQVMVIRNPYSIRPYQHVIEPLMVYLMLAMMQYNDERYVGSYNVGPEEESCVTTGTLVDLFFSHFENTKGYKVQSDYGPHEANFLKLDIGKIKTTLSWAPKWNINKAVEKTADWVKEYINNQANISNFMDHQINEYMEGSL